MTPPTTLPADLLERYLAGQCTLDEAARVQAAIDRTPALGDSLTILKAMPPSATVPLDVDTNQSWQALSQRIGVGSPAIRSARRVPTVHRANSSWLRWGAGVAACGLFAIVGYAASAFRQTNVTVGATEYHTGNAQRATISLPDGSTVSLNVASRVVVPGDFGAGKREVVLEGEAFFTVNHATGAPFVVRAANTATTVLGTEFTARAYPGDSLAVVSVRSGKVQVGMTKQSAVLSAGRRIAVAADGRAELSDAVDGEFSFANGVLTLDNVSLADAVAMLNRWYDADVRIGSSGAGAKTLLGTLPGGSRSDLARTLEMILDVRVEIDGRVVTVFAR